MSSFGQNDDRLDAALKGLENWYDEALANGAGFKSEEDRQAYIRSLGDPEQHPMFAASAEDMAGHPMVEAIRAIKEEDKSLVELAVMYKDEGNEWMKKKTPKALQEAFNCYTHAMTFVEKAKHARQTGSEDPKDAPADLGLLHSQLLSNRAAASLTQKNLRQCRLDCTLALEQCATNMKAHYRLCKATHLLKDYEACLEACARALRVEPTNQDVLAVQTQCEADQRAQQQQSLRTLSARFEELRKTYIHSFTVAKRLGVSLGWVTPTPEPLQLRDRWPMKAQDGSVSWPLCTLYPQYGTLDVVPDAQADAMLGEYLAHMFPSKDEEHYAPPPWDLQKEYDVCDLVAYAPLHSAPAVRSVEEWVQTCLEHYALHQAGSMDVVRHAFDQLKLHSRVPDSVALFGSQESFVAKTAEQVAKRTSDMLAAEASAERKGSVGYLEVHMGCSIQRILTAGQGKHVLPRGVLTLYVYVRGNAAHKQFLDSVAKEHKKIEMLQPV